MKITIRTIQRITIRGTQKERAAAKKYIAGHGFSGGDHIGNGHWFVSVGERTVPIDVQFTIGERLAPRKKTKARNKRGGSTLEDMYAAEAKHTATVGHR